MTSARVARTDEKAARLRAQGAEPVTVDLFDGDAVKAAVDGCEAVLHLATHVPPLRRMASKKGWADAQPSPDHRQRAISSTPRSRPVRPRS